MSVIFKFIWSKKWYFLLLLVFIIILIVFTFKIHDLKSRNTELVQQNAQTQQVIKLTETAYSQSMIVSNHITKALVGTKDSLILINKDLNDKIKEKDEQIVLANKIILKLKNQVINSQPNGGGDEPTVTIINPDKPCEQQNIRVDFKGKKNLVSVAGYTESKPPKYEVNIDLDIPPLTILVTKNKEGQPTAYVDTNDPDLSVVEMKTIVDEKLFPKRKPHNINAILNYNTGYLAVDKEKWQGVSLGVQYIYNFDTIPINIGAQIEATFSGDVIFGLTLGGRP